MKWFGKASKQAQAQASADFYQARQQRGQQEQLGRDVVELARALRVHELTESGVKVRPNGIGMQLWLAETDLAQYLADRGFTVSRGGSHR